MADAAALPTDLLPDKFTAWFADRGWSPRAHQLDMVAQARQGRDSLLIAPTGGAIDMSLSLRMITRRLLRAPALFIAS